MICLHSLSLCSASISYANQHQTPCQVFILSIIMSSPYFTSFKKFCFSSRFSFLHYHPGKACPMQSRLFIPPVMFSPRTLELKRNAKRQTDSQKQTQKCSPIFLSAPDAMPRVEIASKCPSSQICSRTNLSGMIQSARRDILFVCSFGRLPSSPFLWVYILCC